MSQYVYGFGKAPPAAAPKRAAPARPRPPAGRPGRRRRRGRGRGRHWRGPAGYPYPFYQPSQVIYEPVYVMPTDPFVVACEAIGGAYAANRCWLRDGSTRTRAQGLLL